MRVHSAPAVPDDADHFAVGRRNRDGAVGDGAIGVAEEIEAEESEQKQGRGERRMDQVPEQRAGGGEGERVIDAVFDHRLPYCSGGG